MKNYISEQRSRGAEEQRSRGAEEQKESYEYKPLNHLKQI
jgi:hypothetical protein